MCGSPEELALVAELAELDRQDREADDRYDADHDEPPFSEVAPPSGGSTSCRAGFSRPNQSRAAPTPTNANMISHRVPRAALQGSIAHASPGAGSLGKIRKMAPRVGPQSTVPCSPVTDGLEKATTGTITQRTRPARVNARRPPLVATPTGCLKARGSKRYRHVCDGTLRHSVPAALPESSETTWFSADSGGEAIPRRPSRRMPDTARGDAGS